jgi:ankyrin repeat protein
VLLSSGANKEVRADRGQTALDWAIEKNRAEIVKLL